MKYLCGSVIGFAIAWCYYTGTAGELYRSSMPKKTIEEKATAAWGRAQGEGEFTREVKYLARKAGLSF